MNKWLEIILGLILLVIPIYVWAINWIGFGTAALEVLKGGVIWVVLGISDLRE
jgi:hypothetical protein